MKGLSIASILFIVSLIINTDEAWAHWHYPPMPYGHVLTWNMHLPAPSSGIYVQQTDLTDAYRFRIYPGGQRLRDIRISIERGALVVRSEVRSLSKPGEVGPNIVQQSGAFIQWVLLPADANMNAMTWSVNDGVLQIILPKSR